jgi:hypothetical protein
MNESSQKGAGIFGNLSKNKKIGLGVGVFVSVLVIVIVLYFVVFKKDTPKAMCKNNKCNERMYEWIVTKNWAFDDTRKNWPEICGNCESVWYKRPGQQNFSSKNGKDWKEQKDAITAYEDVCCK